MPITLVVGAILLLEFRDAYILEQATADKHVLQAWPHYGQGESFLIMGLPMIAAFSPYLALLRGYSWKRPPTPDNWRFYAVLWGAVGLLAIGAVAWLPHRAVVVLPSGVVWADVKKPERAVAFRWRQAKRIELGCRRWQDDGATSRELFFHVVFNEARRVELIEHRLDESKHLDQWLPTLASIEHELALWGVLKFDNSAEREKCLAEFHAQLSPEHRPLLTLIMSSRAFPAP